MSVDTGPEDFLLKLRDAPLVIELSVLSSTCVRVQFNPRPDLMLSEISHAVVDRRLGPVAVRVIMLDAAAARRCRRDAFRGGPAILRTATGVRQF